MTDGKSNGNGDEGLENYRVMRIGDVVFEGNRHKARPMGQLTVNTYRDGIISPRFRAFRPVKPYNNFYWSYYLHDDRLMRKILIRSTRSGVLMNEMVDQSFLKESILLPSYSEQNRIASILLVVDSMLDLCQRRLDLLTQAKKALMQQIFSQKLRFTGFNDVWKVARGVELFEQFSDKGYPQLPVLSATQDQGMVLRSETDRRIIQNTNHFDSYKRVRPGQFVIHLRSFQGGFAFSKVEGITSPAYTVFGLKDTEQYPQFWAIKFASRKFIDYLKKVTIGIRDGRSIDVPAFMTLPETFPSVSEQKKIAACLSSVDALIAQARAELKQWQEVKKSLLQQMFV